MFELLEAHETARPRAGAHGHAAEHTPLARLNRSRLGRIAFYQWLRPFAVGLVHGLAGSAAVALMVLSIIRELVAALGYLMLFGLGTIDGMMRITLILSAPFAFTAINLPKFNLRRRVASGLVSFVFGVILTYGLSFAEGGPRSRRASDARRSVSPLRRLTAAETEGYTAAKYMEEATFRRSACPVVGRCCWPASLRRSQRPRVPRGCTRCGRGRLCNRRTKLSAREPKNPSRRL